MSRFEQFGGLAGWDHPVLEFGVCPARGTLTRLDRAFDGFYRRCKAGCTPGFPRFKSAARWDSIEYPDRASWRLNQARDGIGRVKLQGVGSVRFRGARRGIRGVPKTLTVRREGSRWRITAFRADVPATVLEPIDTAVGINVGVTELVATSTGDLYGNPRHLRRAAKRLANTQRLLAGRHRGSSRRRQAAQRVSGLHRRIARQRRNLAHQISRRLVNEYGTIVHEHLQITNMVRSPSPRPNDEGGFDPNGAAAKGGLNREILAAGWGQLLRFITYKAEEAGRVVIAVNPRHTSQTCHRCGHVDPGNRHATEFRCTECGNVDHADVNAARNIMRAGLAHRHERQADNCVA